MNLKGLFKSQAQIQEELVSELHNNARDLLRKDFNENVSGDTSMEVILKQIAKAHFKNVYGYEFSEHSHAIQPPSSLGENQPIYSLCRLDSPSESQLGTYLKRRVIGDLQLPAWVQDDAESGVAKSTDFIEKETDNRFKFKDYTQTFYASNEDRDSYKCDSVMVYCHGHRFYLSEETSGRLGLVYFLGVYYTVPSECKHTRNLISAQANASAAALSGVTRIPVNMDDLTETLEPYATKKFETEFGYKYTDNPPTSLRALNTPGAPAMIERKSCAIYLPNYYEDGLRHYINNFVFRSIGLNVLDVCETMSKDVFNLCQSDLDNPVNKKWNTRHVDQTYTDDDLALNDFRMTGVIMSWFGQTVMSDGVVITVAYIYLMLVVYEEQSTKERVTLKLFKELKDPEPYTRVDSITLKEAMFRYTKGKWNDVFGFEFQGQHTQPRDKKPNKSIMWFAEPFLIGEPHVTFATLEKWMDAELFRRGDSRFPAFMSAHLYDEIRDHILRYGSEDAPKGANTWYKAMHTKEFIDPSGDGKDVKHYGLFVFALGEVNRGKMNGSPDRVKAHHLFGYYIGVVSPLLRK